LFGSLHKTFRRLALLGLPALLAAGQTRAPQLADPPTGTPVSWIRAATDRQLHIIDDDGSFPVRYRVRKIDTRHDTTRELIESREGTVARLHAHDGHTLTPQEDAEERQRLQDILDDPRDFLKSKKKNTTARTYAAGLVRQMPEAMVYTYAPGQPQYDNAPGPQVVIDFHSDPNFKPKDTVSEALTGLEGRMWIDRRTQVLTRVDGRIVKPVNFGWGGVLARIYPGGTVNFEQTEAGNGRWIYSRLDEHVTVREILIHTVNENNRMTASDIRLLPQPVSYREAIALLLAIPLPH